MKTTVEHISLWQLFTLVVTYELGSAIVVNIGTEAKQDAWLAILIAAVIGIGIAWMLSRTLGKDQPHDLFELLEHTLGRVISTVLILVYVLYFFYVAARVLRDFCELITTAILIDTPIEVIAFTMMLVVIYILYLGLEVLARTAEIFAPYVLFFIVVISLMVIGSGALQLRNVQPVFGEGMPALIKAIFPGLITFPFGELVVFMVILPKTTNYRLTRRVSIYAVVLAGVLLSLSSLLQVTTLGLDAKERSTFPLLSTARVVSIANFLERIDALVVFIVMLGIVIKVSVLLYAGVQGMQRVFRVPYRSYLLPVGIIVSVSSILIARHFAEHIQEGLVFVPFYLHLPLQFVIPVLLFLIVMWKSWRKRHSSDGGR